MPEHDAILKVTGRTALTLAAVAAVGCAAGLAAVLRRRAGTVQARTRFPARRKTRTRNGRPPAPYLLNPGRARPWSLPAVPRQRQTGPPAEAVTLSPAERAAFAGLVRRLTGHDD
ncbi:hypothetical protein G3I31_06415 [Streptomyces sp. SID9913]|uniref:hypothetical protein n=1 Tax=Streptomyces sp. SID9913 TaxID=2706117 RepID=UPI0013DD0907|nr:hypothetical protein [Streptomyces sp. SID9913]NED17796.1 hypothetical protein [Streptomyces sp. SID9913]